MPWTWSEEATKAFEELKNSLTSSQVLCHYDPSKPLILTCDASSVGLGACLSHVFPDGSEKMITCVSKSLNSAERNYSQIEREGLAIVFGVRKCHKYLWGRRFTLVTDHKPLVSIFGDKKGVSSVVAGRLQRWALFLSSYSYHVQYKKSALVGNADSLSRLPNGQDTTFEEFASEVSAFHIEQIEHLPVTSEQIRAATQKDPILSKVFRFVQNGWPNEVEESLKPFFQRSTEISTENGVLLWGIRVIIPVSLQKDILEILHDAHYGIVRMKSIARQHVWWPNIDAQIESVARRCEVCAQFSRDPPKTPLHPWEFPAKPWQRLHIDFAGPFKNYMWFIVVDAYSKWPCVVKMHSTTSANTISTLRLIFATFGLPEEIVSDNGPQFVSEEFIQFCKNNGIKHTLTSPYHPRSNGEAERFVQTFKNHFAKLQVGGKDLELNLARFLLTYRTTPHATTGVTPSELLMKRHLRTKLDIVHPDVIKNVAKAQSRQVKYFNQGTKPQSFRINQKVWARNYKEKPRWVSGFVVQKLGAVTYRVKIQNGLIWKRHADQLKPNFSTSEDEDSYLAIPAPQQDDNPLPVQPTFGEGPFPARNRQPVVRYSP